MSAIPAPFHWKLRAYCLSLQPVLHDWCMKGRGMGYPVSGMVHIKEPLQLIGKIPRWRSGYVIH